MLPPCISCALTAGTPLFRCESLGATRSAFATEDREILQKCPGNFLCQRRTSDYTKPLRILLRSRYALSIAVVTDHCDIWELRLIQRVQGEYQSPGCFRGCGCNCRASATGDCTQNPVAWSMSLAAIYRQQPQKSPSRNTETPNNQQCRRRLGRSRDRFL